MKAHMRLRVRTLSTMKQVKFENRNRMADEALDDSFRLATTGIAKGTMVSEKPRRQATH